MTESLFADVLRLAGRDDLPEVTEATVAYRAGLEWVRREIEKIVLDRPAGVVLCERTGPLSALRGDLDRYRRIAAGGARVILLGEADVIVPSSPDLTLVPLSPPVFARDWFVLAATASQGVGLIAGALAVPAADERLAKFNSVLTSDERLVRAALGAVSASLREAGQPPADPPPDPAASAVPFSALLPGRLAGRISALAGQLHRNTLVDPLTGLPNQRHFYETLIAEANRFNRLQRGFALLFLEVVAEGMDRDSGLTPPGEEAVRALGAILQQVLRRGVDEPFRLHGAEFGVILLDTTDRQAAQAVVRIQEAFAARRIPRVGLKVRINEYASTRAVSSILEFARRRLQQEDA